MAVEIPLRGKYREVTNGRQPGGKHNNSGASKTRIPRKKEEIEAAQEETRKHQRVLVLIGGRHRRLMTVAEYETLIS